MSRPPPAPSPHRCVQGAPAPLLLLSEPLLSFNARKRSTAARHEKLFFVVDADKRHVLHSLLLLLKSYYVGFSWEIKSISRVCLSRTSLSTTVGLFFSILLLCLHVRSSFEWVVIKALFDFYSLTIKNSMGHGIRFVSLA